MSQKEHRQPPAFIHSALRDHNSLALPSVIRRASGIIIMGRRMKSLIFTTDIAIIRNCNADAVLAVYPFTPQQVIMDAIISASSIPVVCGVGGGFAGTVQALVPREREAGFLRVMRETFGEESCTHLTVRAVGACELEFPE